MTSPSKKPQAHRFRFRIPFLLDLEGEGALAVVGGLALALLVVLLSYGLL